MPEDAICAGGVVLSVGLKDLLAIGACQRREFVGMKARMVWVDFEKAEGLLNLRVKRDTGWCIFESCQLPIRCGRELDFSLHAYFRACRANEPR